MPRRSLSGWRATALAGVAVLQIALVLASSGRAPADGLPAPRPAEDSSSQGPDVAAHQLPGTWLREQAAEGVQASRWLHLELDGAFREKVRIVGAGGAVTEQEHAGAWFYDGTNLKRKYTLMDGRPPSRLRLPFATFEIRFESRDEFVGIDHIHRHTVRYRRVPPGTGL
ncbi:MAG: hypothetical protein HY854_10270 [Burkholderiales bacterium]|nr:hypothetical protein [Burkholderiales bacterium]